MSERVLGVVMLTLRYFLILFILSSFPITTFADVDCPTLTKDNIERFVESMPDIKKWNNEHRQDIAKQANLDDPRYAFERAMSPFQSILYSTKDFTLSDQLTEIVQKHGFKDIEEWAQVGQRLSDAYLATNNMFQDRQAMRSLRESQAKLASQESGLPDHYRVTLVSIVNTAEKSLSAIESVTPREIRLIKKNISSIEEAFTN